MSTPGDGEQAGKMVKSGWGEGSGGSRGVSKYQQSELFSWKSCTGDTETKLVQLPMPYSLGTITFPGVLLMIPVREKKKNNLLVF